MESGHVFSPLDEDSIHVSDSTGSGVRILVGRGEELAAIRARAALAAAGRPGVVWIEGDAGAGKTALLRAAIKVLSADFQVQWAEADEMASDFPFAVLAQLGVAHPEAIFPAGLELVERWGSLQGAGPVVVAVEDLHWADLESRGSLLSAVRRLGQDRVLILVASRLEPVVADGWERERLNPERCLRIRVGPLSVEDVAEMARREGIELSSAAAERLFSHTGGHALYVRTLLAELTPAQLTAREGPLPAPRSFAATVTARLAELPPPARELAVALAVLNRRSTLPVAARVAGIDEPARALDDLAGMEFVRTVLDNGQALIEFAHPLYRAAVYDNLRPSRRQDLHRQAAEVSSGVTALAHRVVAADGFDDALADELDGAARTEVGQRRPALGGQLTLWASQLSADPHQTQTRLLRAGRIFLEGGQLPRVESLRDRIAECDPSPLRSYLIGRLAFELGDLSAAEEGLAEAAAWAGRQMPGWETEAHREATAAALARLALLHGVLLRPAQAVEAAAAALALHPKDPDIERTATIGAASVAAVIDGPVAVIEQLSRRLPLDATAVAPADVGLLVARGVLRSQASQLDGSEADLRGAIGLAARHPWDLTSRATAHSYLGQTLFHAGAWDETLVQARVALSLTRDDPQPWVEAGAHAAIAWVLACRGSWDQATAHLEAVDSIAARNPRWIGSILISRGVLALAKADPAGVVQQLGPLAGIGLDAATTARSARSRRSGLGISWWPWLISALIDTGRTSEATEQLEELTEVAAERRLDFKARIAGLRAALNAAGGDRTGALARYRDAVELSNADNPALDQALLRSSYGRLLAATGDRRTAVAELNAAAELFTRLGATPFSQRLDRELRSVGLPGRSNSSDEPLGLTEREEDVAALVAKGLTNAEVAAQLYVSGHTVDYHLRHIYTKLGIRSRRELRQRRGHYSHTPLRE